MAKILLMDKDSIDLEVLKSILEREGYSTIPCNNAADSMNIISFEKPDLIILDWGFEDTDVYALCSEIKKFTKNNVPVIFINASEDNHNILKAFEFGAVDYVTKPFKAPELKARVKTHLKINKLQEDLQIQKRTLEETVQKQVQEISATQMATIFSLAKLAQSRDDSGLHLERIQRYCFVLAEDLAKTSKYNKDIDEGFIKNILHASPLHDIGKVGIPDRILLKPARLSFEEFEIMKTHTLIGAETLELVNHKFGNNRFIEMGIEIARSHHERWDGKGYPHKLHGEDIPLSARIMSIADVYDALRTRKVYKTSYSKEKANAIIIEGIGTQFDPVMVASFKRVSDKFDNIYGEWVD